MLPDFLVIGAFKAGTTSLHHYLDKHPRIFMTRLKEPNFFAHTKSDPNHDNRNIFPVTDLAQYERLFADARADQLKGEASPGYLPSKQAPRKIKEQIPDIRLLATLRDPVDRAYSHYLMELRNEQISLPPNQAFDAIVITIEFLMVNVPSSNQHHNNVSCVLHLVNRIKCTVVRTNKYTTFID